MSGNYLYIKSGTGLAINTAGDYSLYVKPATTTTLGGVIVGSGLSIDANGLLTSTGGGGGGASVIDAVGNYSLSTNSAFSATSSASQTMGAGSIVKLIFGTEQFDTQAEYDPTLGRFTAKEAGIYFFSACMRLNTTTATQIFLAFYKNGVADTRVQQFMNGAGSPTATTNTAAPAQAHGNNIMKLNAGDYIEVYGYSSLASSTQGLEALAFDTTFFRGTKLS
jgi:hypothetical protein